MQELLQNSELRETWQKNAPRHMQQYDIRDSYADFKRVHQQALVTN
ncbi:hypothetical protein THIOSC15_3160006 [uncultured Thiomicrorhabdus sp.]